MELNSSYFAQTSSKKMGLREVGVPTIQPEKLFLFAIFE
jgi:hypothetical protein